jgi:hypothetical protein
MTEILTNSNDNDITKTITRKGRPFTIYTPEEQEARNIIKVKGVPGRKAKSYTEEEVLNKLEHFREYQRKYIKKEKKNNEIIKIRLIQNN